MKITGSLETRNEATWMVWAGLDRWQRGLLILIYKANCKILSTPLVVPANPPAPHTVQVFQIAL